MSSPSTKKAILSPFCPDSLVYLGNCGGPSLQFSRDQLLVHRQAVKPDTNSIINCIGDGRRGWNADDLAHPLGPVRTFSGWMFDHKRDNFRGLCDGRNAVACQAVSSHPPLFNDELLS